MDSIMIMPVHKIITACHENIILKEELLSWQESFVDMHQQNEQLLADLEHSQRMAVEFQASADHYQASADYLHFQIMRQAAMMAKLSERSERQTHELERLKGVCGENELLVHFVEALGLMKQKQLDDLAGNQVDFDGVLVSYSHIARQVEAFRQDQSSKEMMHQDLVDELLRVKLKQCQCKADETSVDGCMATIAQY